MKSSKLKAKRHVPIGWEWVLDIIEEAHMPHLGLPVKWDDTKEKHSKIAYDPERKISIDITTSKESKGPQIGFITASRGKHPMPGTKEPASVRFERYTEPCLHDAIVKSASGETLIPCIVHGDYVKVESLEADHLQAKENIIKRQKQLVQKLNEDRKFAEFIISQPGMNKFFVKISEAGGESVYYGTLFFYELYFNDIDNIWLICDACNSKKSNQETLSWLSNQWLYGEEFIDYLAKRKIKHDEGILLKTSEKEGLAEVAIEWFWERHANYISITETLQRDVIVPLQVLNIKIDRIIGETGQQPRADRLKVSLDAKIEFSREIVHAKGLGMPKGDDESDHTSSDDDLRMTPLKAKDGKPIPITPKTYAEVAALTAKNTVPVLKEMMRQEFSLRHEKKTTSLKTTK